MDLVANVERFPRPGETISGKSFGTFPGGKGANQAVAAARLGGDVSMLGKVGDDSFADQYLAVFREANVGTDAVGRERGVSTGIALIEVDASGENHIIIVSGANGRMDEAAIDSHSALLDACEIFLLQLEIPLPVVLHAVRAAASRGKTVVLDPAPAVPLPDTLYRYVTYLTPNEGETEVLTGVKVVDARSADRAIHVLLDRGVTNPLIKVGRHGAYLFDGKKTELVAGFAVDTVDTTAAGDAFNGGLAVALASDFEPGRAVRFANAVGAISTTAKGAQGGMPTYHQVTKLIDRR